jgi:hypothetical protein
MRLHCKRVGHVALAVGSFATGVTGRGRVPYAAYGTAALLMPRAARGPAGRPHAPRERLRCIGHRAARRPEGAALIRKGRYELAGD